MTDGSIVRVRMVENRNSVVPWGKMSHLIFGFRTAQANPVLRA
jgi:hypothetical protein